MTTAIAFAVAFSLAASVFAGSASSQPATRPYGGDPLGALKDRRRVLVVVSADRRDARLTKMSGIVRNDSDGFDEREITIVWIVAGNGEIDRQSLPAAATASVLGTCGIADGEAFVVVLIGKDGGVKLSKRQVVHARTLFDLIDSMPMRQREMRAGD